MARIDKMTKMADILAMHPQMAAVLASYGLHCQGCGGARHESLRQGATNHGLDVDELIARLNAVLDASDS
ncbi:DUF1858 domain-containing protein [Desulfuromonas thiophila]|uniref:Hybrid cluster protein-associated redox disulfide domain-containing protein n=1 Tax=Desulfuromonas thiophila TaxID=57664 RepID=A0A1G7ECD3_9BACT|nr:DUF1858 domain-containing protein [Desulfuromonas thiophila]SDE61298.1 hybrid cluster protein-associated redox disulfide domain-containing protein [Desulfuromonas thiophila]